MNDLFNLTGKVAVVVGGAGGIGNAIALGLAEYGADIVVASRKLDSLERVADEIRALGRKALAITVDVTQKQSVDNMVKHILKVFPCIDILVNSAGVIVRKPADNYPIRDWDLTMTVNSRGTFLCCQAVGRVMIKQHSGKIINISSNLGIMAIPDYAAYDASKGAVDSLTRTLACEWAQYNVLVNAIGPTGIETDLTREILSDPVIAERIKAHIPLGRWGQPEDIVGTAIFLASKASDFITGQIIYIDGGETIW